MIITKIKIYSQRFVATLYFLLEKYRMYKSRSLMYQLDNLEHYVAFGWEKVSILAVKNSVLVFAATLGELNAAKSLIATFNDQWPETTLILLGQEQYLNTYANVFPEAIVVKPLPSAPKFTDQLFELTKPRLVLFVEGPSLHGRFPIRIDLTLPVKCLKDSVPLIVVNACLYQSYIASNIDRLEHKLFANLHQQAITQWYVADEAFRIKLKAEGIPIERITVVGDIKFDNIFNVTQPKPNIELSEIMNFYANNSIELIVAGSVMDNDEIEAVVCGWRKVKHLRPLVRLILAPRYINEIERMQSFYRYLEEQDINYCRRSDGLENIAQAELMVLDTFGELAFFYQCATVAFAGRNHGVLEPMRFSKPVVVGPHQWWNKDYQTSYFLYEYMLEHQAIAQCDDYGNLDKYFLQMIENKEFVALQLKNCSIAINNQLGASKRIVDHVCEKIRKMV